MILEISKTNIDHWKLNTNGFILWSSTQQMIKTHWGVKITNDGEDGNGLQYGVLKWLENR